MENEIVMYEATQAVAKVYRQDYKVTSPLTGTETTLKRGVDFDVIPNTKSPSLLKSGAEKICMAYGLMQRPRIVSMIEDEGKDGQPYFRYTVQCDLVKLSNDGREYVFTSGVGECNTRERSFGRASCYDVANSALKKAKKRALVDAALSVSGLSSMFTQDMENEDFMDGYKEIQETLSDDAPITKPQAKRMYGIANKYGFSAKKAKEMIKERFGYDSATEIKQKEYDDVCAMFEKESEA